MQLFQNFSIKNKIISIVLIINILVITILVGIFIWTNIFTYKQNMLNSSRMSLKLTAENCVTALVFEDEKGASETLLALQTISSLEDALLFDRSEKLFASYSRSTKLFTVPSLSKNSFSYFDKDFLYVSEPIVFNDNNLGFIYLRFSTLSLNKKINKYIYTALIIMLLAWVLSYILAHWLQRYISKPILNLADVAKKVSKDADFSVRVKKTQNDETGILYDNFNHMLGQIEQRIQERELAEMALIDSEERFKKISSSANDAIVLMDETGNVSFWNKAAELIFGYSFSEISKLSFQRILASNKLWLVFKNEFQTMKNENSDKFVGQSREMIALRKDGSEFPVEISVSAIKLKGKWNAVAVIKNITERKQAEKFLRKAKNKAEESDKLKSAFLANMSHEIRTPMNAISGFIDLLRRPNFSEEKRQQFIKVVHKNSQILIKLIDDILDISKIEAGQLTINKAECSPAILLSEIYELFEKEKVIREKYLVDLRLVKNNELDQSIKIYTDEFRLRQVISNLLANALKFTESGYIEFGYELENDKIIFYVKDTGIGMPKEKLDLIFNRFRQIDGSSTRKFGGAGLGLAISKGLIDLLGGEIRVESYEGNGSKFYISLPYEYIDSEPIELPTEIQISKKAYDWNSKTILIVEDEESNYSFLKEALLETGCRVLWADDGKPAIRLCTQNKNIDLVVMDIQMPEMDGYEVTRRLKKDHPNLPIIALTAFAMEGEKTKSLEAGCDDFVTKPVMFDEFLAILDKYLM